MDKHTPGPWEVTVEIFDNDGVPERAIQALNGAATVAVALEFGPNNPNMRDDNARLIAAAPELLEALKYLLIAGQNGAVLPRDYAYQKAIAAIAKATGGAT
jgi:hypothetical protein